MDKKSAYQKGRERALAQLEQIFKHNYERLAPHGLWEFAPPVDDPHAVNAMCQMYGVEIEDNLQKAVAMMQTGLQLEDICRVELLDDYEPDIEESDDERAGYISALRQARLLLLIMDGKALAQPTLRSDIYATVSPEEAHLAVETLKLYAAKMVRTFVEDIRTAYEDAAPGAYKEEFLQAARQKKPQEKPADVKARLRDLWDRGFRFWWSVPPAGLQKIYPKIWPPLLDQTHVLKASPPEDLFRDFWARFQNMHFESAAKNIYATELVKNKGLSVSQIDSIALALFDQFRQEFIARTGTVCDDCRVIQQYMHEACASIDVNAYERYGKDSVEAAEWLLSRWQKQAEKLLQQTMRQRVRMTASSVPDPL